MATPQENIARFQEIANRGLQDKLPPDKRAIFDEAQRRGLIQIQGSSDITQQPQAKQANPNPLMELQDLLAQQASPSNQQDLGPRIAELRQLTNQPNSEELAVKPAGISETLFGTGREELRPELSNMQEFGATKEGDTARIAMGLLTTADPKEQQDIIKNIIPEATFETLNEGTVTVEVPDGKGGRRRSVLNRPGLSTQDFTTGIAQMLAFTPGARLAGAAKSLAARLGLASLGSVGTEAARQAATIAQGSEQGIKSAELGAAAVLGPLGEIIGPAKSLQRPAVSTAATDQAEQAVRGLEKATGKRVGLFQPQQSLKPSELVEQALLPQLDAGSARATQGLKKQNREVFDAVSELINKISPESEIATGSERFRTASNMVIDASKSRRRAASSGLFNSALEEGASVNTSPVKDIINESLKEAVEGSQKSVLKKTLRTLEGKKKPPTLRQLDNAKDAINEQLEKKAGSALASKTKRLLVKVKKELVSQMEAASPTYKNAMDEFRRLSPEVERLENSILGVTANKKDTQLKNIAQTIFDPKEGLTNPQAVTRAKKLIDEVDPGAWDDLLRVELNRRVGGIQEIGNATAGDLAGNTPGQLRRAIFGNPAQRNILMKAVSDEQRRNLRYLDIVLERAEKGRSAGSSTIPNKEALEKLRGPYATIRDMILKPKEFLASKGGQGVFDRNVEALTDVLFDTRFQKDMVKLRKLKPESKEAERLFGRMITQAARQQEKQ